MQLFESEFSTRFVQLIEAAETWDEAYDIIKGLTVGDYLQLVTGDRQFWSLKAAKVDGTFAVYAITINRDYYKHKPHTISYSWYLTSDHQNLLRINMPTEQIDTYVAPPTGVDMFVNGQKLKISDLPRTAGFGNAIEANYQNIAYSLREVVRTIRGLNDYSDEVSKLHGYLMNKMTSRMKSEQKNARRLSRLLVTSHMGELEKKLYSGMNLNARTASRISNWTCYRHGEFSDQDIWNIPGPVRFASDYAVSVKRLKSLFREAGGTKKAWKYFCSLRHADIDHLHIRREAFFILDLIYTMNTMVAAGANKAPKGIQRQMLGWFSTGVGWNEDDSKSYTLESRFNILKTFIQKVVRWSNRRSGLVWDVEHTTIDAQDEEGNPILLNRFTPVKKYHKTVGAKQDAIYKVYSWYQEVYRNLSRELLDEDFNQWYKHYAIWSVHKTREARQQWRWDSLIKAQNVEIEHDGVTHTYSIKPLVTSAMLLKEGTDMNHCVYDYVSTCTGDGSVLHEGRKSKILSRIFKVEGAERLTLEIRCDRDGIWNVSQNHGHSNRDEIEYSSIMLGNKLCEMYKEAYEAAEYKHAEPDTVKAERVDLYKNLGPLADYRLNWHDWQDQCYYKRQEERKRQRAAEHAGHEPEQIFDDEIPF